MPFLGFVADRDTVPGNLATVAKPTFPGWQPLTNSLTMTPEMKPVIRNSRLPFRLLWLSASLLLLALPFGSRAEIVEKTDFQYYQINPRSPADLPREIKRSSGSPLWSGFTQWRITYWYGFEESEGLCKLNNITVRLDIRYKMPKLFQPNRNLHMKREFDRYYNDLLEHEEGHGDIAREAASAVESMLAQISAPDCERLPGLEKAEYRSILREYRDRQRRYDLVTDHGRWQGRWAE